MIFDCLFSTRESGGRPPHTEIMADRTSVLPFGEQTGMYAFAPVLKRSAYFCEMTKFTGAVSPAWTVTFCSHVLGSLKIAR